MVEGAEGVAGVVDEAAAAAAGEEEEVVMAGGEEEAVIVGEVDQGEAVVGGPKEAQPRALKPVDQVRPTRKNSTGQISGAQ